MSKNAKEYLLGAALGFLIGLFFFHKLVFGATVNNPQDAEKAKAEAYLTEEGVEIPEEVAFWCEYYGTKPEYNVSPEIAEAISWVESRCKSDAQSADKSCKGIMQIRPACHQARMARLNALNVFGLGENIHIGIDYLAELGATEDIAVALAIYNGWSDSAVEKVRQGKITGYVKEVLEIADALERVHGK